MRLVVSPEAGVVELNYSWLPTWIGINTKLKNEMEDEVSKRFVGKDMTDQVLDEMSDFVLEFFVNRFPEMEGLREFLDSLKFVKVQ